MVRRSGHVCICWRQKPFARSTDRLAVQVAPFAAGIRNSVPLLIWIKLYFSGPPWPSPMWGRRLWQTGTRCLYFFLIYIIRGTWVVTLSGTHIGEMEATLTTSTITRQAPVIFWSHGWMIALTHILAKYSTIYIILLVIYNYYIVYIHYLNLCVFCTIIFWFRRILAYNQSLWNTFGELGG